MLILSYPQRQPSLSTLRTPCTMQLFTLINTSTISLCKQTSTQFCQIFIYNQYSMLFRVINQFFRSTDYFSHNFACVNTHINSPSVRFPARTQSKCNQFKPNWYQSTSGSLMNKFSSKHFSIKPCLHRENSWFPTTDCFLLCVN